MHEPDQGQPAALPQPLPQPCAAQELGRPSGTSPAPQQLQSRGWDAAPHAAHPRRPGWVCQGQESWGSQNIPRVPSWELLGSSL